jgi:hypothetical protein
MLLSLSLAVAIAAPLRLEATPSRIVLGDEARATLTITSPAKPALSVNVGRIENLRRDGPDRWLADYVPPDELFPQVAIVAAALEDEVAWTALPLCGRGIADVRTRARARISVKIGDETFGPVHADAHGEAHVPVVVPPGVREAWHGRQRIALQVPATPRLHVVALRERVRADLTEQVAVVVLATQEDGSPLENAHLRLSPARGEASSPERRAPGEYRARWTLQPGRTGTVRLVATIADGAAPRTVAQIAVDPGPAAAVDLTADRESISAGSGVEIVLRAKQRDSMGNASSEPLELSGIGGFGTLTQAGPLQWRLRPSDSFDGREQLEVAAHPRGRDAPRASVTLRLVPGEPAFASVDPASAVARAGGAPLQLRVHQSDRFGNSVGGAAPSAVAEEGRVAAVDPTPGGGFVATYVPPDRWDRDRAVVEMRWPGASARADIVLLPQLARWTLSPKLGALSNFGRLHSPLAAFEAAYRTDRFGPELGIATEVAWYFVSQDQAAGQLGTAQARDDFVTFSALFSLRRSLGARTAVWLGAGPSIELVASRLQIGSDPRISETGLVPGMIVALGAERRFGRTLPFAELRWSWHRDPAFSTLTGAISAFSLVLGNRFELL